MEEHLLPRIGWFLCLIMIPILVSACGFTPIFYATFEADTIGSPPSENPPEDLPGDLIWPSAGPGYLDRTLSVVNDTKLSSKSLKYTNINAPDLNRFVGFVSKEVSLDFGKTFYAYWSGHINLDNTGSGLHIWLGDAHLKAIAALEFKHGTVRLQTSEGETPTYEAVGTYANDEIHFVIMQVGKSCRCYKISIFQSGGGAIDTGIKRVLNQDALNTQRPTLYLLYYENTSGSGAYVFDNVTISENVTWYRPWKPQPLEAMFEMNFNHIVLFGGLPIFGSTGDTTLPQPKGFSGGYSETRLAEEVFPRGSELLSAFRK